MSMILKVKKRITLSAVIMMTAMMLSGCHEVLEVSVGVSEAASNEQLVTGDTSRYEITSYDYSTEETEALEIDLDSVNEGIDGIYTFHNSKLTICAQGSYIISGKMNNGSLHINVFDDEVVHLFLNNVEIKSSEGAALYVENAAKVIITAREGTSNVLSTSSKQRGVQKASVFSNSDLTLNGRGNLSVYGYQTDGVRSKDQIKIIDTNLYVKAKEDGIRGNDGVIIHNSITKVECEGTGIISNSDKGMAALQGGSCNIIAGKNAIDVSQYLSIHDSQIDLYSVLEAIKCDGIKEIDEGLVQ